MQPSKCIDHGYLTSGYANVYSKKHGKSYGLHRLILAAKLSVDVTELIGVAMHTCDNKRCIDPDHIQLGSQSQNVKDAYSRGLAVATSGESHPSAKLTDSQIEYVLSSALGPRALGRELGVSHSVISRVRNGKARASQRVG